MCLGDMGAVEVDEESTPLRPSSSLVATPQQKSNSNGVEYRSISHQEEDKPILSTNEESEDNVEKLWCRTLLILAAFLFASLNVALRCLYALPGPPTASALSTTRGWLSVACFIPFLMKKNEKENDEKNGSNKPRGQQRQQESSIDLLPNTTLTTTRKPLWVAALELAVWGFGAQGLMNIGLLSVESARVSFLTQTSVVMTPVVSAIAGQRVNKTVWLGCLCALGGLTLLSNDGGGFGKGLTVGDLICLGGALSWSLYVFRLSAIGDYYDEIDIQASKNFFLACLYSVWCLISFFSNEEESLWPGWTHVASWAILLYSALGPGAFADLIQQRGQTKVSASEANVILSVEPVFTTILGRLILEENTSLHELLGGGLIISAAIIASL